MRFVFSHRHIVFALAAVAGLTAAVQAGVPRMISYQGRLTDDAGAPLDTTVNLTFIIYEDSVAGSILWEEVHPDVIITGGLFTVKLGSYMNIGESVFNGTQRWLGVAVGDDDPLTPRTPIVSTAYTMKSQKADTASLATQADHAKQADTASYAAKAKKADTATVALNAGANGWVDAGNFVYLSTQSDSVGIGVSTPSAPLEVEGPMHAIIGNSHGSGTAAGVYGSNDSDGFGLMGISTNGRGVTGLSVTGFGGHFYGPKNYFSSNLGIGTEAPGEMLHIYKDGSGVNNFLKIQSAHASNWGRTGIKFQTPQNLWWLFMDDDINTLCPDGGLGLWNNSQGLIDMIWTKEGHVGIPGSSGQYRLEVYAPGAVGAILGQAVEGIGVQGYSQSGFGGYFFGPKHYFSGNTGFGTDSPTHRVTVNGELALQKNGVTKYHINYYNTGFNICETTVADYRLYIKDGGNVGIGTSNPTTKLHVAGLFHADAFEANAIGRANILDEVGIASSSSISGASLTSSWSSYMSREITVPTSGYILALGCARFGLFHEITGYTDGQVAFSNLPDDLNGGIAQSMALDANVPAGNYYLSLPFQRLFYASAAGTYTYYMIARNDGDNSVSMAYKQMALLFIPTVYASKNGVVLEQASDDSYEAGIVPKIDAALTSANPTDRGKITKASMNADTAALLDHITALNAQIEALTSRVQMLENK